MTIEHKPNFILISDVINGQLVSEKYIGYSEDEAVKRFKEKFVVTPFDRDLLTAFKQRSFPVNPIPFLNALSAGVRANGTDWIHSDEAKALLWVVMAQSFKTQIIAISMHEEWKRLNKIF